MAIEAFEPRLDNSHQYAIAIPFGNGDGRVLGVSPIQTYPTLEALEQGFSQWNEYSVGRRLSRTVKIEKVIGNWTEKTNAKFCKSSFLTECSQGYWSSQVKRGR